ncbi:MAG: hypothetical protein AAGK37_18240 [Pseudomonadota bacterium]
MQLTLAPGQLYEIAFVDAPPSQDPLATYLGPMAGAAQAEGAKGVASLAVTHIEHADFECQSVAIVAWPSPEVYAGFHGRDTWPTEVLMGRRAVPVQVEAETTINLSGEGRYEFAAFWMNRTNAALNLSYFETMGPLIKSAAPRPLTEWSVCAPEGPLATSPSRFNWLEWTGTPEARAAMFTSDEFKSSGYLRALALDRLATVMVTPST